MLVTDEQIETLSVSQAAKITGLGRDTIAHAMNAWEASHGRFGLRFICPATRRLVRRSALLEWFQSMERLNAHV